MSLNPSVQQRAQAQLDAVVGSGRLPDFGDRPALPYIDAIVREALRWMPIVPLGIAHRTVEDDEFGGFFIPKGSIIIPNSWYVPVSVAQSFAEVPWFLLQGNSTRRTVLPKPVHIQPG